MQRLLPLYELTLMRLRLFYREPSAVFWTFGFPIILSIGLGIAFRNRPPDPIAIGVESGPDAQRVAEALARRADVQPRVLPAADAHRALRTGKVTLVVTPGPPRVYTFDEMRPESRLARVVVDDVLQAADGRRDPIVITERHVEEPGGRYIDFLIPGLIGVNLMSSGMWGIGYVIVEMRTQRLLKRLLATPMRRGQFLVSFLLMRLLFLFLELPVLLVFAWLAFDVRIRGSIPLLVTVSTIGAISFAAIGLLLASRAQNTQTVSGLMNTVMIPMYLLSGVFFSSAHFPDILQPIIRVLPLTALNDALRAIMNDGAGVQAVAFPVTVLVAFSVIPSVIALRIFRWQ
jgi:ABC-type multidrug transport system permease subunit